MLPPSLVQGRSCGSPICYQASTVLSQRLQIHHFSYLSWDYKLLQFAFDFEPDLAERLWFKNKEKCCTNFAFQISDSQEKCCFIFDFKFQILRRSAAHFVLIASHRSLGKVLHKYFGLKSQSLRRSAAKILLLIYSQTGKVLPKFSFEIQLYCEKLENHCGSFLIVAFSIGLAIH